MVDYSSSSFGLSGASCTSSLMGEAEQSKASFDLINSNANYPLYFSFCNFDKMMFLEFFHDLPELPEELQRKAVKDFKNVLNGENSIWQSMVSNGFLGAFFEFLKNDCGRYTVQALKAGLQFFLAFLSSGRYEYADDVIFFHSQSLVGIQILIFQCHLFFLLKEVLKYGHQSYYHKP